MIVTEHFVFVHVHKTGGQTLNKIISRCFPGHQVIGYHYPYSLRPDQYARLPVVAFVRNPWDWYVSWYAFNRRPDSKNALFAICSDGGKEGFRQTVTNLVNIGDDSAASKQYRDALISVLPKNLKGNRGIGLTQECIQNFQDNNSGYFTWLWTRMLGDVHQEQMHVGKFEKLEQDFLDILSRLQVPQDRRLQRAFVHAPHINSSRRSHYSHYYDDDLKDLIARKDKTVIDRFKYEYQSSNGHAMDLPDTYAVDGSFRKLRDDRKNFLLLKKNHDITSIEKKLSKISQDRWTQSDREHRYKAHNQTQSLLLIHDDDMRHRNPTYHDLYQTFEEELKSIFEVLAEQFGSDGYIIRALFAKLLPGSTIMPHIDFVFSLLHCRRVHVPIVTNDEVIFSVGGEQRSMRTGDVCEINNATVHSVDNRGKEARVHLIVDWVPNSIIRAMDSVA